MKAQLTLFNSSELIVKVSKREVMKEAHQLWAKYRKAGFTCQRSLKVFLVQSWTIFKRKAQEESIRNYAYFHLGVKLPKWYFEGYSYEEIAQLYEQTLRLDFGFVEAA